MSFPGGKDILSFRKIATGTTKIRVLCALWSATVLEIDNQLVFNGYFDANSSCCISLFDKNNRNIKNKRGDNDNRGGACCYSNRPISGLAASEVKTVFGDTSGVLGALGFDGGLWRFGIGFTTTSPIVGDGGGKGEGEGEGEGEEEGEREVGFEFVKIDFSFDEGFGFLRDGDENGNERMIDQIAIADNGIVCVLTCLWALFFFTTFLFPLNKKIIILTIILTFLPDPKPSFSTSASIPQPSPLPLNMNTNTPSSSNMKLHSFPSFSSLLTSSPQSTITFPPLSTPTTPLASSTTFTSLTPSQILTWGSPLHSALGRHPTAENPASTPGPVLALGGIRIRKISTRGWITAALSTDDELYLWGGRAEERKRIGPFRRRREGEDVVLVELGREKEREREGMTEDEILDRDVNNGTLGFEGGRDYDDDDDDDDDGIVDVAVGESHILILTTRGRVYAVGEGKWGQLGTGRRKLEGEWVLVCGDDVWEGGGGERDIIISPSAVSSNITRDVYDDGREPISNPTKTNQAAKPPEPGHRSQIIQQPSTMGKPIKDAPPPPKIRKRIIGVECGVWNSFLIVAVE